MYENAFFRPLEIHRITEESASSSSSSTSSSTCSKCSSNLSLNLKRSNAIRRKNRSVKIVQARKKQSQSAVTFSNKNKNTRQCDWFIENGNDLDTAGLLTHVPCYYWDDVDFQGTLRNLTNTSAKGNNFRPNFFKTNFRGTPNCDNRPSEPVIPWFLRWKFRKIHPICEDKRIQQVDGGFFEKFGSLFREHAEFVANQENEEKRQVAEAAQDIIESSESATNNEEESPAVENDVSESEESSSSVPSSDSETEEQKDKTEFISVAWNIDELYTEILYEILHNIGCDVSYEIGQTALISYVQDAFKIPHGKHQALLEEAEQKEPPKILLNVEIIEAKDLRPKDSNGLSDPFVTLFLQSNTSHRYNTSVKSATLSPSWEEHFALPVSDNSIEDTLCLEVWDFDPAESVKEKFGKIFEVKGVKGIRKLVKEIAVTAATGQHENELIGIAKIPLKTIPASGMTMWYSLDKKNKANRQGVIKIRVAFSSEKNIQVAQQEHKHLLRLIMLHELEVSKVAPYWWCDTFSPQAEAILTQHIAQSSLTPCEVAMCKFSVYCAIHQNHPLSFSLFSNLLEKLVKPLEQNSLDEEDVKVFWEACKRLLPSCFSVIRKIRKKGFKDKTTMKQVSEVLYILSKISGLEPPSQLNLFPPNVYPWVTYTGDEPNCDIMGTLNDAVCQGASDWFNHIMENNVNNVSRRGSQEQQNGLQNGGVTNETIDLGRLQQLLQLVQLVRSDLQKAIEFYDRLFQETINFQYAKALYIFYQAKLSTLAEPDVREICKNMKRLSFTGFNLSEKNSAEPLSEGTLLFEVYLALQRFATLGKDLCPLDFENFHLKNFHQWFHGGVAQWLDIAVYKALQRIEKAVELDTLVPVDNTVKYSSSAVDTLTIFYQVKVFWQQLNWPDVEGCYTFIAKIIDDICRCCVFYSERMSMRLEGMGETPNIYYATSADNQKKFEVTHEWCLAINNIEYVSQSLGPFTDELGMCDVIEQLSELRSPLEAQRCQDTLQTVISNAIDTVRNEIIELLETVVSKMVPSMRRLLIEGAELFNQDSNSVDRLMMYVDSNLRTLHTELNEENFNRILEIVWDTLSQVLNEIIETNLEKRRPPSFFANLHKTLDLMLGSFKSPDECTNCDSLKRTELLLKLNGLETSDLIHQVNLDLHKESLALEESQYGELCVKIKFEGTSLMIEVMNARNLIPMDSNGSCDAFVRIHLLPEDKFSNVDNPKTQTQNKTLFPLFDEKFTINLTTDQRRLENGLVLFSVKDKDLLGYNNQYIGEGYVHFQDIPDTSDPLGILPQVHLKLLRPSNLGTDAIKALERRPGDKQAREFLKKLKQRAKN